MDLSQKLWVSANVLDGGAVHTRFATVTLEDVASCPVGCRTCSLELAIKETQLNGYFECGRLYDQAKKDPEIDEKIRSLGWWLEKYGGPLDWEAKTTLRKLVEGGAQDA